MNKSFVVVLKIFASGKTGLLFGLKGASCLLVDKKFTPGSNKELFYSLT